MKRTNLTAAVIAGIAGVVGISNMASAIYLNGDGLGQVLIYPYYTVNNGNSTALTIVNTTNQGKAVKVRFLEGYNSREVLDFNLYMSPYDVWTAQVVPVGSAGGAGVFSNDNSCTVPKLPSSAPNSFAFSTFAFDGTVTPKDGGPLTANRTAEGYVEMIEMGVLTNVDQGSLAAATHRTTGANTGIPANCLQLVNAWTPNSPNPYWLANNNFDIAAATGGLMGTGTIVNVAAGTVEGYNAEAIDRFWATPPALGNTFEHTDPSNLAPSLKDAPVGSTSYVFAQATTGAGGQLITTTYPVGIDAVTSLFMADTIYNEYWTGGGTVLNSEWVVTFPTKRFYVDPFYVPVVAMPFDVRFSSAVGNNGVAGSSCSPVGVSYYDREEQQPGTSIGTICPSPLVCTPTNLPTNLCYEANVVTFNQDPSVTSTNTTSTKPSTILGSHLTTVINPGFSNGWASINLVSGAPRQHQLPSPRNIFLGLPGTGFWVESFQNNSVKGAISSYTSLYKHKLHRSCNAGAALCSDPVQTLQIGSTGK